MAKISLEPSPAYRRRVFGLLVGLLGLALTYVVLVVGTTAMVVVPLLAAIERPILWPLAVLAAVAGLPLAAYLLDAPFEAGSLAGEGERVEAGDQPRLVAFVDELAERIGAPAPERVSLVEGVNAAMVRGRSALGSVVGGRRELVVGLGLVNVLALPEFEAVLAHEFGHFAQSSTRVGQWAHQVSVALRTLAAGRTRLDARVRRAARSRSILVRALAWILGLGVRGARGLLVARLRRLAQLNAALARELELNADLHAVALCGSDALVAALWRAQRGALAMNAALGGLAELGKHGVFSDDLYAHQLARLAELDGRLADEDGSMAAALRGPYVPGPKLHFPPGEVPAELSWYAHPSYREREANAKRDYVPAPARADQARPTWTLFEAPVELRRRATVRAYAELGRAVDPRELSSAEQVEARLAAELDERRQDPRYHGFYDNRLLDPGELDGIIAALEAEPADPGALREAFEVWRGPPLAAFMATWAETEAELASRELAVREAAAARRAAELDAAHAGDRAVLRWLWSVAGERRPELRERYAFTLWVQAQILAFNHHHAELAAAFARHDTAGCVHARDLPVDLVDVLDRLRAALGRVLDEARTRELPALRNLSADASLADALGVDEAPPALTPETELGPWLRAFMAAVSEVHGRLRSLHYKNLGQLLSLQEQIEAAWTEALSRAADQTDR